MTWDFQAEAARRTRRLVIGLVVLVVILVAGILLLLLRPAGRSNIAGAGGVGTPGAASTPASGGQDGAATATFTPDPEFVAPTRWVTLPGATTTRLGFPAGFPHTPEGAAAAAVAMAKATVAAGWDYDAADRVVQAYAVPAQMDQSRQYTHQVVAQARTNLGLPESDPLPSGASSSAAIIGVQWTPTDADDVQVSVLDRATYTTSNSTPSITELRSIALQIQWVGDDWRDVLQTNPITPPAAVDIGSSAFNAAGWTAIQQGSAG